MIVCAATFPKLNRICRMKYEHVRVAYEFFSITFESPCTLANATHVYAVSIRDDSNSNRVIAVTRRCSASTFWTNLYSVC